MNLFEIDSIPRSRRKFIKSLVLSPLFLMGLNRFFNVDSMVGEAMDDNEKLCLDRFNILANLGVSNLSIGDAIVETGKSFLGTEYVGGTLDIDPDEEKLTVCFTGFDCVTFVETCLVFARCLKSSRTTFRDYKKELEKIRYRGGILDGYGSRLHYFTDWIYDNQEKGILKDMTAELGGVEYVKQINFMSKHPNWYKQLLNKQNLESIKIAEEAINSRTQYYIPVDGISKVYDFLQNGDIIATTTNIPGLDVTHTGYVCNADDRKVHFLHASLKGKRVIISENQLQEYVEEDSKKTGIIVARAVEI